MMTREEALRRLDAVMNELVALRTALAEGWIERPVEDPTQLFLAKCGGWEDTRSLEEIIVEIYATRTVSQRGKPSSRGDCVSDTLHYLLDTDMCIYLLNGHPRVKARVVQVGIAALAVAIPTVGELYFGAYNSGRVEANVVRVRAFLSPPGPQVLSIDEPAVEQFGRLKAMLRREGRLIGDIDLFIAGVALRHGLMVVTNNTGHFERIPELPLENWLELPQTSS